MRWHSPFPSHGTCLANSRQSEGNHNFCQIWNDWGNHVPTGINFCEESACTEWLNNHWHTTICPSVEVQANYGLWQVIFCIMGHWSGHLWFVAVCVYLQRYLRLHWQWSGQDCLPGCSSFHRCEKVTQVDAGNSVLHILSITVTIWVLCCFFSCF